MGVVNNLRKTDEVQLKSWRDLVHVPTNSGVTYTIPANAGDSVSRAILRITPEDFTPIVQLRGGTDLPIEVGSAITALGVTGGGGPFIVPAEGMDINILGYTLVSIFNRTASNKFVGIEVYKSV